MSQLVVASPVSEPLMKVLLPSPLRCVRRIVSLASICVCLGIIAGSADAQAPPDQGERIRVELRPTVGMSNAVASPWEGTFLMFQERALVATDELGGAQRLPFAGIEALYVERDRSTRSSILRGAAAGAAFGLGMWGILDILCRSGCDGGFDSAWLPATITGTLVAGIVAKRSASGGRWVQVSLPF